MTHGIDLEREIREQSEEDWVFGAVSQAGLISIPIEDRRDNLPKGELQFGIEDFMDCASRGPVNVLETLYTAGFSDIKNAEWLHDNGYVSKGRVTFSDRFVAINSGTTRNGNSFKAPLEAIRKHGLIPKGMLPADSKMTFDDYHNPDDITPAMRQLGAEFTRRFTINYERVSAVHFAEALKDDMVICSGYAWPVPVNGTYPRIELPANHCFMLFKPQFYAFDNYTDRVDGDFIKRLAQDFKFFDYGYRIYLSAENTDLRIGLYKQVIELMHRIIAAMRV